MAAEFPSRGGGFLDDDWFEAESAKATAGLIKVVEDGYMELRFGLHEPVNKSQIELLTGVRAAEIHTFGWPIAVTLENRRESAPHPYKDGIRAEISITDDRRSYDYWAARNNGDFFVLTSLFEDQRRPNEIFFNTRIVRVTEALLFAQRFYMNLGVRGEVEMRMRVGHAGLADRTLSASNPSRRPIRPAVSHEDMSAVEVSVPLSDVTAEIVALVKQITAPMFLLFDFTEFEDSIYADIVKRFMNGEVT